jgi:outer membrane lipoprotein SlyB
MKTIQMLLFLGVIIAGTTFGCKKQSIKPAQSADHKELLSQVKTLTHNYLVQVQAQPSLKTSNGGGVLGEDGRGAALGALKGALTGLISGGLHGAVAGAIIGGVTDGIVASAKALWFPASTDLIATPMNPPTDNPGNAYDDAGAWHYTLLAELIQTPSLARNPDGSINYTSYRNYALQRLQEPYPHEVQLSSSFITPASIRANVESTHYDNMVEFANSLTRQQVTDEEKQILVDYFSAYDNMESGDSFSSYSITVEDAITASDLDEDHKAKLLVIMATMRHGVAFYGL